MIYRVNELKRYCRSCFTLIENLEGYERKLKTALEAIDSFKTFLDDTVVVKREIEEFTGKPVSFDSLNNQLRGKDCLKILSACHYRKIRHLMRKKFSLGIANEGK